MPKNLYISALLDVYGLFLNDKQREMCEYYYNEDLSLSEIAENTGITRQGVRDQIKRGEQRLLDLEKKCGYCSSFSRLKELAENMRSGDTSATEEILNIIEEL